VTSGALCVIGLLAAAPPADPREAARQVMERGGYQTDLPAASPRPRAESPESTRAPREASPGSGRGEPRTTRGGAVPGIPLPPAALVWAILAGLFLIALAWAARQAIRSRQGEDAEPAPVAEPPPSPARRVLRIGPLTDVEDLARQGRFGEAIHLLLLHLFAALQRRPATAPAPAHTSREVLARTRLAGEARAALGVLVSAAERIHFGGREAVREDYENCLGHYRRFLDSFERAS
jgi:hypothetical protein